MSTGSLMTRQTYDRAPRLTKLATAHISPAYMRAINTILTLKILASCQMSTGSLRTRQTYDRAPRLTNWPLHTFQRVLEWPDQIHWHYQRLRTYYVGRWLIVSPCLKQQIRDEQSASSGQVIYRFILLLTLSGTPDFTPFGEFMISPIH